MARYWTLVNKGSGEHHRSDLFEMRAAATRMNRTPGPRASKNSPQRLKPRRRSEQALARLVQAGPVSRISPLIAEILAFDKRVVSLTATIPFAGPWLIARSTVHTPSEKLVLQYVNLVLTVLLVVGIVRSLPDRSADRRARVKTQIRALAEIAEGYRAQHGSYPDADTWKRTAELPDGRFFDPWGRPYRYEPGPTGVTIGTLGRDGVEGGMDDDDDVFKEFSARDPQ